MPKKKPTTHAAMKISSARNLRALTDLAKSLTNEIKEMIRRK